MRTVWSDGVGVLQWRPSTGDPSDMQSNLQIRSVTHAVAVEVAASLAFVAEMHAPTGWGWGCQSVRASTSLAAT